MWSLLLQVLDLVVLAKAGLLSGVLGLDPAVFAHDRSSSLLSHTPCFSTELFLIFFSAA